MLLAAFALAACRRGRILSYEEYASVDHDTPYVLRFTHGRGALLFFGSAHTYDPGDPQVGRICGLWTEFRPTLAFNEGGDPPAEGTIDAAVARFGESGLVRHLARRDRVPVASIEPSMAHQVNALRAAGFGDEQTKLFFVLRQVPQHKEQAGSPMTDVRAAEVLAYFTKVTGIVGPPTTPDELTSACARLLPGLRDWREVPQAWFDPVFEGALAFTNTVSLRLSVLRDAWVVDLLGDVVSRGEQVFAVMGASHVVVQEPALRARFGRPSRLA